MAPEQSTGRAVTMRADTPRLVRQAKEMEAANAEMQRHAQEVDEQCRALEAQAAELHARWRASAAENQRLQCELAKLRDVLGVRAAPHLRRIWLAAGGGASLRAIQPAL